MKLPSFLPSMFASAINQAAQAGAKKASTAFASPSATLSEGRNFLRSAQNAGRASFASMLKRSFGEEASAAFKSGISGPRMTSAQYAAFAEAFRRAGSTQRPPQPGPTAGKRRTREEYEAFINGRQTGSGAQGAAQPEPGVRRRRTREEYEAFINGGQNGNGTQGAAQPEPGARKRRTREEYEAFINGGKTGNGPQGAARPEPANTQDGPDRTSTGASAESSKVGQAEPAKPAVKALYVQLGLEGTASDGEIKKAYRRMALQYHPDKNPGNPAAAVKFTEIQNAHELLMNPAKRKAYDAGLIDEKGLYPNGVAFRE